LRLFLSGCSIATYDLIKVWGKQSLTIPESRKQGVDWLQLEHFHKYCSHAVGKDEGAVFLDFGFVLAQSQAAAGMLPHSASPKHQKSSLRMATVFLQTL
jgi:hypothetical protein